MIIKLTGVSAEEVTTIRETIRKMKSEGEYGIEIINAEKGRVTIRALDSYGSDGLDSAIVVLWKLRRYSKRSMIPGKQNRISS